MNQRTAYLSALVLLVLASYLPFSMQMPKGETTVEGPLTLSAERAMEHIRVIAQQPHAVGFEAHGEVREYLLEELRKLGLEPTLQEGYTSGDWGNVSRAVNIVARVEGKKDGKALLLMSHYDSQPHSSYGASDAGSGVAVILEAVRVFREQKQVPDNDIIILFTDAEELGLNGADLFTNQHPWAKEVGLALNFESRGSGGPGIFLIETNGGNAALVDALSQAELAHPVGNSLAYSIYKLLPNDTDLTVLREDGDIQGLNFAFIDDHYDYHTAMDRPERLDPETLTHQLEYLATLLPYFASTELDLRSSLDQVYFNVPFFGLVTYPYAWNWILWALAAAGSFWFIIRAASRQKRPAMDLLKGFLPLAAGLLGCGLLGYFFFPALKGVYPLYREMLHGFTYNGDWYILAAVCFSLALLFGVYARFRSLNVLGTVAPPMLLWVGVSALVNLYLPGAGFLIIPTLGLLAAAFIYAESKNGRPVVLVMVSVPALWILLPFLHLFPVGLGLRMMIAATLLTVLLYGCLLPFFASSGLQKKLALIALVIGLFALLGAHLQAPPSAERPRPSSLVYLYDSDQDAAYWASTDINPSAWTQQKISHGSTIEPPASMVAFSSKYGTSFRHFSPAPTVDVAAPRVEVLRDTVLDNQRHISLQIRPQRDVQRLEVYTNAIPVLDAKVNGTALDPEFLQHREARLFTHYISNNDPSLVELVIPADQPLELSLYEASHNLLHYPGLQVSPRPATQIPTPFVLNDAVILKKTLRYE